MAYMTRLGLWGPGTPFAAFQDFIDAIEKRFLPSFINFCSYSCFDKSLSLRLIHAVLLCMNLTVSENSKIVTV